MTYQSPEVLTIASAATTIASGINTKTPTGCSDAGVPSSQSTAGAYEVDE